MRYYVDFEFEDHQLMPLSIGIVSQDDRELYLVRPDWLGVVTTSANYEWLMQNVVPDLRKQYDDPLVKEPFNEHVDFTTNWAGHIAAFVGKDPQPEFWGYFCDYDWVLFCHLFGRMIDLPANFPNFCLDLKQLALSCGVRDSLKKLVPIKGEHCAVADARWMRTVHNMLIIQYGRSV